MSGVNPLTNSIITRFGSQPVDFFAITSLRYLPKKLIFEILGQVRLDLPGYTRLTLASKKFSTNLNKICPLHSYQAYIHRIALHHLDMRGAKFDPVMSLYELVKINPKNAFKIVGEILSQVENSLNQPALSSPHRSVLHQLEMTSHFLLNHMGKFPEMTYPLFERILQINNFRSTLLKPFLGNSYFFCQPLISYCIASNKQDELAKFPLHQENLIELEKTKSFLGDIEKILEESNSLIECLRLLLKKYEEIDFCYGRLGRDDFYKDIFIKLISKFPSEPSELCTGCVDASLHSFLLEWCLSSERFDIALELPEKQIQKMKKEGEGVSRLICYALESYLQILDGIKKSHFRASQDLLPKIILKIDEFAKQISMHEISSVFLSTLVVECYCAGGVDPQKIIKFFDSISFNRLENLFHLVLYLVKSNHSDLAKYFNEWKDGILKERHLSSSFTITQRVLPIAEAYINIDIKQTKELLEVALQLLEVALHCGTPKYLNTDEINNAIAQIWTKLDPERLLKVIPKLYPQQELDEKSILNLFKLVQWMNTEELSKQFIPT